MRVGAAIARPAGFLSRSGTRDTARNAGSARSGRLPSQRTKRGVAAARFFRIAWRSDECHRLRRCVGRSRNIAAGAEKTRSHHEDSRRRADCGLAMQFGLPRFDRGNKRRERDPGLPRRVLQRNHHRACGSFLRAQSAERLDPPLQADHARHRLFNGRFHAADFEREGVKRKEIRPPFAGAKSAARNSSLACARTNLLAMSISLGDAARLAHRSRRDQSGADTAPFPQQDIIGLRRRPGGQAINRNSGLAEQRPQIFRQGIRIAAGADEKQIE